VAPVQYRMLLSEETEEEKKKRTRETRQLGSQSLILAQLEALPPGRQSKVQRLLATFVTLPPLRLEPSLRVRLDLGLGQSVEMDSSGGTLPWQTYLVH